MFKRCNVVMLPTNEKTSPFVLTENNFLIITGLQASVVKYVNQHIYIVSDDKIEEGNYCIDDDTVFGPYETTDVAIDKFKKVIATTDTSIKINMYDINGAREVDFDINLPRPSDSFISKFIEEYNKDNIITDVMVEYERCGTQDNGCLDIIECQSTTEGGFYTGYRLKINPKDNTITIKKVKDSWDREEVIALLKKVKQDFLYHRGIQVLNSKLDEWVKNNL